MNFPDERLEVCFPHGGEASAVTVELDLLVSGLLVSLQWSLLSRPAAAVATLPALPVLSLQPFLSAASEAAQHK